ncbi:hypothetical protein IAU59_007589 [Kwoniella sp. CBS 9459]
MHTLPALLKPDEQRLVEHALPSKGKIVPAPSLQINAHDLRSLRPGKWVNDVIIFRYLQSIETASPSLLVYDPLNLERYRNLGFASGTHTDGISDPFARRAWLLPINLDNTHWVGAVVYPQRQRVVVYDPLDCPDHVMRDRLAIVYELMIVRWGLFHESMFSLESEWQTIVIKGGPKQPNGFDCGVFTCLALHQLSTVDDIHQVDSLIAWDAYPSSDLRRFIAYQVITGQPYILSARPLRLQSHLSVRQAMRTFMPQEIRQAIRKVPIDSSSQFLVVPGEDTVLPSATLLFIAYRDDSLQRWYPIVLDLIGGLRSVGVQHSQSSNRGMELLDMVTGMFKSSQLDVRQWQDYVVTVSHA